jgi:hypothetical protein
MTTTRGQSDARADCNATQSQKRRQTDPASAHMRSHSGRDEHLNDSEWHKDHPRVGSQHLATDLRTCKRRPRDHADRYNHADNTDQSSPSDPHAARLPNFVLSSSLSLPKPFGKHGRGGAA